LFKILAPKDYHGIPLVGKAAWAKQEEEYLLKGHPVYIIVNEKEIKSAKRIQLFIPNTPDIIKLKLYTLKLINCPYLIDKILQERMER
jgi:hypothetical protein